MKRPPEVLIAIALVVLSFLANAVITNWPLSVAKMFSFVFSFALAIPIVFILVRVLTGDWLARLFFVPVAVGIALLQFFRAYSPPRVQYTESTGVVQPPLISDPYVSVALAAAFIAAIILLFTPAANRWYRYKKGAT